MAHPTVTSIDLQKVKTLAENYYANGDYFCSEAVVRTIRDEFGLQTSDDAIMMASGFPVGIGGRACTCGAISGGILALGLVFGRSKPKDPVTKNAMKLSAELYDSFIKLHKVSCCRILTKGMRLGSKKHMAQCVQFTGEMAVKTAEIIAREFKIPTV